MSSLQPVKDDEPRNLNSLCREKYLQLPRKKVMNHAPDFDQERVKLYKRRNERVREVCKRYNNVRKGFKNPYEGEFFIYDMKNRLAWCRTAKVRHCATC